MADNYRVSAADMKDVADVIREKGGTSDALVWPEGFKSAVNAIQTGSGGSLEACTVTFETDGWATEVGFFLAQIDSNGEVWDTAFMTQSVEPSSKYEFTVLKGSVFLVGTESEYDGYVTADGCSYLDKVGSADVFEIPGDCTIWDGYY